MATKKCKKCGNELPENSFYTYFQNQKRKYFSKNICKSCSNKQVLARRKIRNKSFLLKNGICVSVFKRMNSKNAYFSQMVSMSKAGAKRRNLSFSINTSDIRKLWDTQNGLCALTGLPMTMILGKGLQKSNVSVDRIDSSLGYMQDNVQLVRYSANIMKGILTVNELRYLCSCILSKTSDSF